MMDNKTKQVILERLYKTASTCTHCGRRGCLDSGSRELFPMIKREDVLEAINLDEYFFKETPGS